MLKRKRNQARRLHNLDEYREANLLFKRRFRELRKKHFEAQITEISESSNPWRGLYRLKPHLRKKYQPRKVIPNSSLHSANEIAEQLLDIYESAEPCSIRTACEYRLLIEDLGKVCHQAYFRPISEREVYSAIHRANKRGSPGWDGILPTLWMKLAEEPEFLRFLTAAFNELLFTCTIPDCFRRAEAVAIPKPGGGIRPISLLSTLSKVLERIISDRLSEVFTPRPGQFGCRSGHSPQEAILRLMHRSALAHLNAKYFGVVFLDFRKAYDLVCHKKLILELNLIGVQPHLVLLIDQWLKRREFRVKHNGHLSDTFYQPRGLMQGGSSSVILWQLFCNSMPLDELSGDQCYMDDTCLVATADDLDTLHDILQAKVDKVTEWCREYGVCINPIKTRLMLNSHIPGFSVTVAGTVIYSSESAKYLGMNLASSSSYPVLHYNVKSIAQATRRRLSPLHYLRSSLAQPDLSLFAKGLIRGKLQYFLPMLGVEHKDILEPLEVVWRRTLRVITGALPSTPKAILYAESGLPPLHILIEEYCGKMLARMLTNPNLLTYEYLHWNGEGDGWSPLGALWKAQRVLEDKMLLWQNLPFYGVEQLRKPSFDQLDSLHELKTISFESRQEALEAHAKGNLLDMPDHAVWTDGGCRPSERRGSTGCCYSFRPHYTSRYHISSVLTPVGSSFHAECLAAEQGFMCLNQVRILPGDAITFYTDSRSLVEHIQKLQKKPREVRMPIFQWLTNLQTLYKRKPSQVRLVWIPGHSEVGLNPTADTLATLALNSKHQGAPVLTSRDLLRSSFRQRSRTRLKYFLRSKISASADPEAPNRDFFKNRPFWRPEHEQDDRSRVSTRRRDEISLFRLRSGHARHAAHLFRVGILESAFCPRCLKSDNTQTVETVEHIFLNCLHVKQTVKNCRTALQTLLKTKKMKLRDALISFDPGIHKCVMQCIRALHNCGIHL